MHMNLINITNAPGQKTLHLCQSRAESIVLANTRISDLALSRQCAVPALLANSRQENKFREGQQHLCSGLGAFASSKSKRLCKEPTLSHGTFCVRAHFNRCHIHDSSFLLTLCGVGKPNCFLELKKLSQIPQRGFKWRKNTSMLALKTCILAHTIDTEHLKCCCFLLGMSYQFHRKEQAKLIVRFFLSSWFYRNMEHQGKQHMCKLLLPCWILPAMEYMVAPCLKLRDTKTDIKYNAGSDGC